MSEITAVCHHAQIAMSCGQCAREREEARKKAEAEAEEQGE